MQTKDQSSKCLMNGIKMKIDTNICEEVQRFLTCELFDSDYHKLYISVDKRFQFMNTRVLAEKYNVSEGLIKFAQILWYKGSTEVADLLQKNNFVSKELISFWNFTQNATQVEHDKIKFHCKMLTINEYSYAPVTEERISMLSQMIVGIPSVNQNIHVPLKIINNFLHKSKINEHILDYKINVINTPTYYDFFTCATKEIILMNFLELEPYFLKRFPASIFD